MNILICSECPAFRAEVPGPERSLSLLHTWIGVHPVTLPTVTSQLHAIMTTQNRGRNPHLPSASWQCCAASGMAALDVPYLTPGNSVTQTRCHMLLADWFLLAWDPQQKVTTWSQGVESYIEKHHIKAGRQTLYGKDATGVAFEG